jgi:integrase
VSVELSSAPLAPRRSMTRAMRRWTRFELSTKVYQRGLQLEVLCDDTDTDHNRARKLTMARPWRKNSEWPYLRKRDGKKSYRVGYFDHEKTRRTKSFSSAKLAKTWMDAYSEAERFGPFSLRAFLLDDDAREAAGPIGGKPLGEVVQMWLALDANPASDSGLAEATYQRHKSIANRHILGKASQTPKGDHLDPLPYAVDIASLPISVFNKPAVPRSYREAMRRANVPRPTQSAAWKVLSSCLSWAATSNLVPELQTNGAILANESKSGSTRRSMRGTASQPRARPRGKHIPSHALSPRAVELIRVRLGQRAIDRDPLLAHRDQMVASLQYGLAARNQEVWGLRWECFAGTQATVEEVISWGHLSFQGKTEGSTERVVHDVPSLLLEDLAEWKKALEERGFSTRPHDFIISGDLGGDWGVRDPKTSACHLTQNQCRKFGPKYFSPAVRKVAEAGEKDGYPEILGATPYSLRRGGISLMLRTMDSQIVAAQCGSSISMLSRFYSFGLIDLVGKPLRAPDIEWREARKEVQGRLADKSRHLRAV